MADVLEAEGRPFTTEELERIESRIVNALISRMGMISEQEFWTIAESVLGGLLAGPGGR